ncbi:hypothetical protein BZB76_1380 [Actinomadura pelletieri DSM 43383]|uniref:Uncharacterized protein n=1 Tax=Actinomadura pelletieri DSM 43383 TaxID=1120940 RepID=A0A495R0M8_9ACTN|nr:DUF5994 family protein [Actinomadura pelletieri]RKS79897.1 hypothetical protein BZB76_1380 [Actinomadura pelletieri DSM 43383]
MRTAAGPGAAVGRPPPSAPRLALQQAAPVDRTGPARGGRDRTLLDGGWWPLSADPVAELPGLLLALRAHGSPEDHQPIKHVLLRTGDWDSHPRRLLVHGPDDTREVRLSWFDNLPPGLLTAVYADGRRIDLLTVPASTDHTVAQASLELAAHPNHRSAPDLLAAFTAPTGQHVPD